MQINIAEAQGWDWFRIFGVYLFTWLPLYLFVRSSCELLTWELAEQGAHHRKILDEEFSPQENAM